MTQAELRAYQCERKRRRETADAAIGVARSMKLPHKSVRFGAFHCRWCQGWHVGRESRNRPRVS
jgi:hypothetical protein